MTSRQELNQVANEAREWLFDWAAPLWLGPGLCDDGMFAEALSLTGTPIERERRTRVQARQIYVYSELGRLGWSGQWQAAANGAIDVLLARGKREDGFFVHRFGTDGQPCDNRADLYDTAFLLFAFGHAARALNRADLLTESQALIQAVERDWMNPAGGFNEGEVDGPPRRQNPHMHLLEASIIQWQVTQSDEWRTRITALSQLARRHFIDSGTGALTEFFAPDWSRPLTAEGQTVEPGHCFEWSWLFEILGELGLGDVTPSDGLVRFARTNGLTPGGTRSINAVSLNGTVVDADARLWPQTERLKAALARWRRLGDQQELIEAVAAYRGLACYLDTPVRGLWFDKLMTDGEFVEEPAPASSFYHITCALVELIRTAECD